MGATGPSTAACSQPARGLWLHSKGAVCDQRPGRQPWPQKAPRGIVNTVTINTAGDWARLSRCLPAASFSEAMHPFHGW